MTFASRVAALAVASLFLTGSAFAQTPAAPAPATPAEKAAPMAKAKPEQTAASKECSTEADAKGLKGKERKKFRNACKKEAAGKAKS